MKILTVCDQGNNRSVTLAHQLKYLGHDVLSCGLSTNHAKTLMMLFEWADKIIVTDKEQLESVKVLEERGYRYSIELWDMGPDVYPRPFNKELLGKVQWLVSRHRKDLT